MIEYKAKVGILIEITIYSRGISFNK